jgi:hypothetical protein
MGVDRNATKELATWFLDRRKGGVIQGVITPDADNSLDLGSETAKFKKVWCVESSCGGGGGLDPHVFVPALGGNLNGWYTLPHKNYRMFGGGPYRTSTNGWDHFGIVFPYPELGEDGNTDYDGYSLVAHGLWTIPAGVTGFKVTPIIRWKRRVVSAIPSNLEFKSEILDVTLRPNGEWRTGFTFFGESDAIVPFTSPIHLWSDTSALEVDLSGGPGQDGPTGWVFDNLYPGMVAMFMGYPSTFSGSVDPRGRGLFVGWMVEQSGPGVSINNTLPDDFVQADFGDRPGFSDKFFPKDNHGPIMQDSIITRVQGRMTTPEGWTGMLRATPMIYKNETASDMDIYFNNIVRRYPLDHTQIDTQITVGNQGRTVPAGPEGIYKFDEIANTVEITEQSFVNLTLYRWGTSPEDTYTDSVYAEGWIVEYDPEE